MANVTRTLADSSGFIPQAWATVALQVLRSRIALARVVARDTDFNDPGWKGKQITIPYPGTFTAQTKTENVQATVQTPANGSSVTVALSSHKYVDFIVEDWARAQANVNLLKTWVEPAAIALAEQVETDLFSNVSSFNSNPQVGTAGTDLGTGAIRSARKILDSARVPATDRHLVAGPKDIVALLNDGALTQYFAYHQTKAITDGSLADLYGFRVWESQIDMTSLGAADVQTVTIGGSPTGGTFTLTFNGFTTSGLAYNATAAQVQTALQALASIGTNNVTVAGPAGGPYTITFAGVLANGVQPVITGSAANLTGGTPTVTIAHTTSGSGQVLAIHKNSMIIAFRPFEPTPDGAGVVSYQMQDPESGIILRVQMQYGMADRGVRMGFDVLYGTTILRNNHACVINS